MTRLQILGRVSSINVRKVLCTCDEIGLEYDREDWGMGFRPTSDPAFRALNPNGLVPVVRDGDLVLWESNVICRYLAAKQGRADLLPADPAGRARVEMWMDWQATEFNASWRYAFLGLVRKLPGFDDPKQMAASIKDWTAKIALLDRRLRESGGHVAGAAFTLADIPVGLGVNRWFCSPIERPDFPAVGAYYDRLRQRPAFARHSGPDLP